MFIKSVKVSKGKLAILVWGVLIAILLITFLCSLSGGEDESLIKDPCEYLMSLGYQVDETPVANEEIILPTTFGDVYENYNNLQREAGFDLTPYAGQKVARVSFSVNNYPDQSDVIAQVLVCEGRIIGGSIGSPKLDGFMHGLRQCPGLEESVPNLQEPSSSLEPSASSPQEPSASLAQ